MQRKVLFYNKKLKIDYLFITFYHKNMNINLNSVHRVYSSHWLLQVWVNWTFFLTTQQIRPKNEYHIIYQAKTSRIVSLYACVQVRQYGECASLSIFVLLFFCVCVRACICVFVCMQQLHSWSSQMIPPALLTPDTSVCTTNPCSRTTSAPSTGLTASSQGVLRSLQQWST